ncbi:alpha-tocopherol transfer protein-like [Diabrotica undecimpunctata]|uniref:alpha-tocopherol transfer protein-like n=1 Tax=Diabrotica undecimpunctata TaxID=50387 RepID=UPI003B63DC9D
MKFKFSVKDILDKGRTSTENIDVVKEWLLTVKDDFVPSTIQDELVVLFLLSCDNDIDLTKKTVSAYYRLRKEAPEIHDDRNTKREDIKKALNTLRMITVPVRTVDNYQVLYFSLRDTNYRNFELLPTMKASLMLLDIEHQTNPPDGVVFLADMQGFDIRHVIKLRPDLLKKYFTYLGEGVPIQFVGLHLMNGNYFLDNLMSMLRIFISPDVLERLHVHPEGWNPMELLPKECLPKEMGGDLGLEEELTKKTMDFFKEREDFWEEEETMRKRIFK